MIEQIIGLSLTGILFSIFLIMMFKAASGKNLIADMHYEAARAEADKENYPKPKDIDGWVKHLNKLYVGCEIGLGWRLAMIDAYEYLLAQVGDGPPLPTPDTTRDIADRDIRDNYLVLSKDYMSKNH